MATYYDFSSERRQARDLASLQAPYPRVEPEIGAMVGGFIAAIILAVFTGFAGIAPEEHHIASLVTLAVGAIPPFLFLRHQKQRHLAAFERELALIEAAAKKESDV